MFNTDSVEDDVARVSQLKVHPLIPVWRAGFAVNGALWNRDLAVRHYDPTSAGGAGGQGRKRQRGRGGASSARNAAAGGVAAASAVRGGGGVVRGRGRGGDAVAVARPPVIPALPMHPSALQVMQDAQPASPIRRGASGGAVRGGGAARPPAREPSWPPPMPTSAEVLALSASHRPLGDAPPHASRGAGADQ